MRLESSVGDPPTCCSGRRGQRRTTWMLSGSAEIRDYLLLSRAYFVTDEVRRKLARQLFIEKNVHGRSQLRARLRARRRPARAERTGTRRGTHRGSSRPPDNRSNSETARACRRTPER